MSLRNKDKLFRNEITDQIVAAQVANALRAELAYSTSAIKQISKETGVDLPAINKWYNGLNAPKSSHFLMLARIYPDVFHAMLEMVGRSDVWQLCKENSIPEKMIAESAKKPVENRIYSAKFVTINVVLDSQMASQLNHRQLWFLTELRNGVQVACSDIVSVWNVALRTARRDIAGLEEAGMVMFTGARKTGYYVST